MLYTQDTYLRYKKTSFDKANAKGGRVKSKNSVVNPGEKSRFEQEHDVIICPMRPFCPEHFVGNII